MAHVARLRVCVVHRARCCAVLLALSSVTPSLASAVRLAASCLEEAAAIRPMFAAPTAAQLASSVWLGALAAPPPTSVAAPPAAWPVKPVWRTLSVALPVKRCALASAALVLAYLASAAIPGLFAAASAVLQAQRASMASAAHPGNSVAAPAAKAATCASTTSVLLQDPPLAGPASARLVREDEGKGSNAGLCNRCRCHAYCMCVHVLRCLMYAVNALMHASMPPTR
jgi:hypothetical protein